MAGILEATYINAKELAKRLESIGYRGIQSVDIWDLKAAHTRGDRRSFEIEGNAIIIPSAPSSTQWGDWNNNIEFEMSFNSEGQDNDDWIHFNTALTNLRPFLGYLEHLIFYKFTVRNSSGLDWDEGTLLRLYVLQDPSFIVQLNKLLKDIVT